jgi:Translation initiation factor eIF3 subunit
MSDEDDWEKQLEDDTALESALKKEEKKAAAFKDEDAYDSDEERKKKDTEKKAQAALAAQGGAAADGKKKAKGTKDYDKMFEERLKMNKPTTSAASQARIDEIRRNAGLTEEAKAQQLAMAAEMDITESLFADIDANSLTKEEEYISFGKKVSAVLYEGQAPYRIPVFFKELLRDLPKQLDSKKIKEILDSMTALYNEKVRDEKEKEKSGKGGAKGAKAQLKSGKAHINQQLVTNLMGEEDAYGDEEGEGYARAPENEYDFM